MAKLKPCPFCGDNDPILSKMTGLCINTHGKFGSIYWVECWDGCCKTWKEDTKKAAIEAWNRRAE